ncbi:MAG: rhodanese-like domain-containing protein [Desulfovibrio sp.]
MDYASKTLREMNFDFLGTKQYAITKETFLPAIAAEDHFFLDVRTDEELKYSTYPWATHIPLQRVPDNLESLPKNKTIVVFCSSLFRASFIWTYLKSKGFEMVKVLMLSTEEIATQTKPTPLFYLEK